ncbi:hypothetical protein M427DRAFT_52814 [Gonapodya prolifera JEL478]|uniref:Uncharacterized protein n=1 Tax=Gonapodya prolifera (strain JEL478) TaxID=1344416 RepID=A0A139ARJ9_GONPJ|nr:hypothetical protein M427DRAFT_52814 [Gonapodya prolifera JEL478]|eukprot:KXS19376.1 hypothetical protein M427DRAFT_52814 [Gonapodya prolifera JEL478]
MQNLQQWAAHRAGIPLDEAFVIDDKPSVYQTIGHRTFVRLSTEFYNRVYEDSEQAWFRDIFAAIPKEDAIRNQYEFFIQRMGGPPLYSKRKGHPALIARHAPFTVTLPAAERWLEHMRAALDEVATPGEIPEGAPDESVWGVEGGVSPEGQGYVDAASRARMWNFLKHTAWFIAGAQEVRRGGTLDMGGGQQSNGLGEGSS